MNTYVVINKATSVGVFRYTAEAPMEWSGFEFATHEHVAQPDHVGAPPVEVVVPNEWYLNIGPFYDRFGAYKIPILASADPIVQAIIKDSAVRQYIDLKGRRGELSQAIDLMISKGYLVNKAAVLNVKPTAEEVYRG